MFYRQVHTHVRTSPSGSTMQARFPFHAFTGFGVCWVVFFGVVFGVVFVRLLSGFVPNQAFLWGFYSYGSESYCLALGAGSPATTSFQ